MGDHIRSKILQCVFKILKHVHPSIYLGHETRNPNIETRNKFKYQMTKVQNLTLLPRLFWSLEHLDFFIVSNFGFRASDLS